MTVATIAALPASTVTLVDDLEDASLWRPADRPGTAGDLHELGTRLRGRLITPEVPATTRPAASAPPGVLTDPAPRRRGRLIPRNAPVPRGPAASSTSRSIAAHWRSCARPTPGTSRRSSRTPGSTTCRWRCAAAVTAWPTSA